MESGGELDDQPHHQVHRRLRPPARAHQQVVEGTFLVPYSWTSSLAPWIPFDLIPLEVRSKSDLCKDDESMERGGELDDGGKVKFSD
ncbi:hypothetical protein U1Q18_023027 [Sarracenia purpurea var. burkii]